MRLFLPLLFLLFAARASAATLHVGTGQPYPTLSAAVGAVQAGDTILIHAGTYAGGLYFANLQGNAAQWITIRNAPGDEVVFEGGNNAIQLTDPAYLHLRGLIFQHQTGNGVNIDDGGTYDSPAHHLLIEDCTFRDMAASGNNDQLKLSGLDYFTIRNCTFQNGAAGGSGVDMVGCHHGVIERNYFENQGSNAIQCKGGSEWVRIEGNFFRDCGQRTLNLGGSTGLQFFRPDTAHFEAANLQVFSNIIVGSWAPVAWVGSVGVVVANNTIYQPENWVLRILQETVDPDRFLECGDNSFINNIVYLGDNLNTEVNVGPNTAPETFLFSNNLWFNADDTNWNGPNLPVAETGGLLNADPLFADAANYDFSIPANSPAAGSGVAVAGVALDFFGQTFANPPSIGAAEANPVSPTTTLAGETPGLNIFPNPARAAFWLDCNGFEPDELEIRLSDHTGRLVWVEKRIWRGAAFLIDADALPNGVFSLQVVQGKKRAAAQLMSIRG